MSPDSKYVAVCRIRRFDVLTYDVHCELAIVPLDGSDPYVATEEYIGNEWTNNFSWSPNGQWLAYSPGGKNKDSGWFSSGGIDGRGHLLIVATDGSGTTRDLTADMKEDFFDGLRAPYWSTDSQRIYRQSGKDIWIFSIDGTSRKKITPEFSNPTNFSFMASVFSNEAVMLDEKSVSLFFTDRSINCSGIAIVDLTTGNIGPTTSLPEGMNSIYREMTRTASVDEKQCYLFLESATCAPELWEIDIENDHASCFWAFNSSLKDVDLSTKRMIDWIAPDGRPMRATILLPPNYNEEQPLPMIADVYAGGGASMLGNAVGRVGLTINPHLLTTQGYAVLYPDLLIKDRLSVRKEVSELVKAVVDRAVELGIADPDRLGVMGQSYGGYTTLCLLTETDIFKAALCNAGISDLIRMYGDTHSSGFGFGIGYCENGQAGIGGNLWEKRDTYIENSPFYHLDKVITPILLTGGVQDPLSVQQLQATFIALRRLGKQVELRLYEGEGHCIPMWSKSSQTDFYARAIEWFDKYLKG